MQYTVYLTVGEKGMRQYIGRCQTWEKAERIADKLLKAKKGQNAVVEVLCNGLPLLVVSEPVNAKGKAL